MKLLTNKNWGTLLLGSTFYGTGGGGSPLLARDIYQQLNRRVGIPLRSLDELVKPGICITAYTVGSLSQKTFPKKILSLAKTHLEKRLQTPIIGIIPVEIGPLSIALAVALAADLNLPLVDADFVGGRSTPEVFLETITLFNIPRTLLIVASPEGDIITIETASTYKKEETLLRSLATSSGGYAYVLGYPILPSLAKKSLVKNTVSQAIRVGQIIQENKLLSRLESVEGVLLFQGKITDIATTLTGGFTTKQVTLKNKEAIAKVFIKNESLVFWINEKTILTCPDLIILLNAKGKPLYNNDLSKGMNITIVGVKSAPLWRSNKGVQLFNPKLFGFPFKPVLLI